MPTVKKSHPTYYQSKPLYFAEAGALPQIDREQKVLRNVVLIQEGEAKGHGVYSDDTFIREVVEQGQAMNERGLKSRFGHPNMSGEALGTYLGRFHGFKTREKEDGTLQAIADLHFDDSAAKSPKGDLSEYLMSLAESNPDACGMSICFFDDGIYFKDTEGKVINGIPGEDNETDGKVYIKLKELVNCDAVDEGAATDGLFSSANMHSEKFAVQATEFLDSHPQILEFIEANPDKVAPFFKAYNQSKNKMSKKTINQKSFMNRLQEGFNNLFKELSEDETTQQFDIDGALEDGTMIRIKTESETATEGDAVVVVDEELNETQAPAGDHVVVDGPLAGQTITVDGTGALTGMVETPVEEEEAEEEEQMTEELSAANASIAQLQAEIETLKTQLSSSKKRVPFKKKDTTATGDEKEKVKGRLTLSHGNEEAAERLELQKAKYPHLAKLTQGHN